MKLKDMYKDIDDFFKRHEKRAKWLSYDFWCRRVPRAAFYAEDIHQSMLLLLIEFFRENQDREFENKAHVTAFAQKFCFWRAYEWINRTIFTVNPGTTALYRKTKELKRPEIYGSYDRGALERITREVMRAYLAVSLDATEVEHYLIAPPEKVDNDNEFFEKVMDFVKNRFQKDSGIQMARQYWCEETTLREIGRRHGVSGQQVRQTLEKIVRIVREAPTLMKIAEAHLQVAGPFAEHREYWREVEERAGKEEQSES